jgi:hypothetical protein
MFVGLAIYTMSDSEGVALLISGLLQSPIFPFWLNSLLRGKFTTVVMMDMECRPSCAFHGLQKLRGTIVPENATF